MLGKTSCLDRWLWRRGILDQKGGQRLSLQILTGIIVYHLVALLACVPWLFSWSGVAWALGGIYLFGTLGINIGYHRLLTHRAFACARWLEHGLTFLGACSGQGSPMRWVALHRMHHQHSDETTDPHSPRVSFFWSHMGWFLVHDPAIYNLSTYDRYARDLLPDRFYKWMERPRVWRNIQRLQWVTFAGLGALAGGLWTWSLAGALQLGLSWLVWGVFVRTVAVWHITWSINSVTHLWGYRNFETHDASRNNWLVGLLSNGEGWHNNHHAQPRCAAHGQRWWELDVSYLTIRVFAWLGIAWGVVLPGERRALERPEEPRTAA
jgi:stearoyl-CoA desaturase (delta-9 desaturase)